MAKNGDPRGVVTRIGPLFSKSGAFQGYLVYFENVVEPLTFNSSSRGLAIAAPGDLLEYKKPLIGKPKFVRNVTTGLK